MDFGKYIFVKLFFLRLIIIKSFDLYFILLYNCFFKILFFFGVFLCLDVFFIGLVMMVFFFFFKKSFGDVDIMDVFGSFIYVW